MLTSSLQVPTPLERLQTTHFSRTGVQVFVKRDDLLHPDLGGNKARKLVPQLAALKQAGTAATFGGAFSTHLPAFALAGDQEGFRTIGFVRSGEGEPDSLMLLYARDLGMRIIHLGREDYRRRNDKRFQQELQQQYGSFLLIPEGGTNSHGIQGVADLILELPHPFDVVCCPFGTGGTAIGLLKGLRAAGHLSKLLVFSSFCPPGYAQAKLAKLAHDQGVEWSGVEISERYSFGGFMKVPPDLWAFAATFQREFSIALDPIYNAKMLYGVWDMIRTGYFRPGTRILVYHTGGVPHLRLFD